MAAVVGWFLFLSVVVDCYNKDSCCMLEMLLDKHNLLVTHSYLIVKKKIRAAEKKARNISSCKKVRCDFFPILGEIFVFVEMYCCIVTLPPLCSLSNPNKVATGFDSFSRYGVSSKKFD